MTATIQKLKDAPDRSTETIKLTPTIATALLEHNALNRPLSQPHVDRIARQISEGKWKFNGDTIKISDDGAILDGQHRLWAVIMADKPVETILVKGIAREAFSTIDTIRKHRSGADILSLLGISRQRVIISAALTWLLRWQRLQDRIGEYRNLKNKVENSDIEEMFASHRGMIDAVERVRRCRLITQPSLLAFLYYIFANRDPELAERFIDTLESPAGVSINDPFFKFRARMLEAVESERRRDPIVVFALAFKAWKAAAKGKTIETLSWRKQGRGAESFPTLDE